MPHPEEAQKTLVEMLRMTAPDLKKYMRDIFVDQLEAGYDYFTWGESPHTVSHETGAEADTTSVPDPQLPVLTGAALKGYRHDMGLSQAELGKQLGVSGQAISDWEREKAQMSIYYHRLLQSLIFPTEDMVS